MEDNTLSDNTELNAGSGGDTISTDDLGSVKVQRVKVQYGVDGFATDVSDSNPMPVDDAGGSLTVDGSVSLATALPAGTNNIGDVDVATVPAPLSTTGGGVEADALRVTIASDSTGVVSVDDNGSTLSIDDGGGSISIDDGGNTITVDGTVGISGTVTVGAHDVTNAGTFATQVDGAALTSLQLIDDVVYIDDTSTHSTGSSKGVAMMAAATPSDGSVNANDFGVVAMTTDRKLHVSVQDALPAGTNAIGKLSANSGVDIGDVDVTSISAGTNLIGDVGISGARTAGGTTAYKNLDVDETEDDVKTSAGQVYWIHAMNLANTKRYLKFYNATAANVTVGTTTPVLTFSLPTQGDTNGAGFTLSIPNGIAFSTAICIAATTGVADNDTGAPGANEVVVCLGYA